MTSVARLADVTKTYGSVTALRNVSLELGPGITALLGANGAGKTTAVKLLLGLAKPNAGSVTVCGDDPRRASTRQRIGAMMQVARVPETLEVREHVAIFREYYPNPLPADEVIEMAGLTHLASRRYGDLSGGERQRVLFALALCGDPTLLLLDEPTVGFDVETRRNFWDRIASYAKRGKAVLLTTHYLEEADALADRVVMIDRGSIVADGTSADVKARAATKIVRCRTQIDQAAIRQLSGVRDVRSAGGRTEIVTSIAEPVVRELLALDGSLSDLEVSGAGLEEAFLSLTAAGRAE